MQNTTPDCNVEDPLAVWKTRISYSFGIPAKILDEAEFNSNNRLWPFIEQVQSWISKRPFKSVDGFQLPPPNWEEKLMAYFPMTPEQIKSFSIENGDDKEYVKWRHIVMCHLRKLGDSYVSGSDNSSSVELEISEFSDDIPLSIFPMVINIEKPICVQKTRFIKSLKEMLDNNKVVQIYGGSASGKTTAVCLILTHLTYSRFSAEIRLLVTCRRTEPIVLKEFKKFMNYLKNKKILTQEETDRLSTEKHFCSALLACLGNRPFSVVIGFDTVKYDRQDKGREDTQVIASLLDTALSLQKNSLKLIIATPSKDYFFSYIDLSNSRTRSKQVKTQVFDLQEAVDYLGAPPTNLKENIFLADDEPSVGVYQPKGAEELAVYYCCNPLCLKVAKQHCETHHVSYTSYLKSMRASYQEYALNVSQALEDNNVRQAFLALHNQDDTEVKGRRTSDAIRVLSYVDSASIPIVYIGRVCQILREMEEPGSLTKLSEDTSLLNLHEASRVVHRLAEDDVLTDSSICYPNGEISIATHRHDANRTQGGNDHSLQIALRAMLGMLSKDNSKTVADIRLTALRPHVESLIKHAVRKLREKSIDEGMQLMTLCRLREIYSQALMQGRVDGGVEVALNALEDAFLMVWEVIFHYNKPCGIFCFSFDGGAVRKQLLFDEAKDAERESHEIAKRCKIAGESVDFIEDYSMQSLVLRPKNMREFIERIKATSPGSEEREAEKKLLSVKLAVEHHVAVDKDVVEALRKFNLFLTKSELKSSFFAERLTSLFHTYGRQVLYNKDIMTRLQQKKCEYYTDLAHHVAKASRQLTGVRLMNEYISLADAAMPRMLHHKQTDEGLETRLSRYQRAYDWLKSNREPKGVFFENGHYRQVAGTPHTMLNADRLMVKAQCKMLSGKVTLSDRKDALPDAALEDCQRVLDVAYANYSDLGFAPRCCVQVAKLYGAVGEFQKAFETYDMVFNSKVNPIGRERGSFAWAVDNLCRTTKEYLIRGNGQVEQRRCDAIGKCKQVISLDQEQTGAVNRMCEWVKVLEGLM